ncbi:MAG: MBL fold metallo-hydrolase [Rhodocyclaceae bacterium]|nr:MBL fold metallo-hydrolase [Rhodocyclaceae bacterium]
MLFRQLHDTASNTFTYLLADTDEREAALIDPLPGQSELLLALLGEYDLRLRYVLRTHVHRPDRRPCTDLCRHTGARIVIGTDAPADEPGERVAHGATLVLGNEVLRVLATPGHTPCCVSYLWRDRLFCGDTLEIDGCCEPSDELEPGHLYDSVTQRIFLLPDETLIFPGHDRSGRSISTVREERLRNRAYAGRSRETFITDVGMRRLARPPARHPFEEDIHEAH